MLVPHSWVAWGVLLCMSKKSLSTNYGNQLFPAFPERMFIQVVQQLHLRQCGMECRNELHTIALQKNFLIPMTQTGVPSSGRVIETNSFHNS